MSCKALIRKLRNVHEAATYCYAHVVSVHMPKIGQDTTNPFQAPLAMSIQFVLVACVRCLECPYHYIVYTCHLTWNMSRACV